MYQASRFRLIFLNTGCSSFIPSIALLICAVFLLFSATALAQGLGSTLTLHQKQAPKIYLPHNTFSVVVHAQPRVPQDQVQSLQAAVENLLPKMNGALKVNDTSPDVIINCTITDSYATSFMQSKSKSVYKKTGSHTVYDSFTKMNKTVDDYGFVHESYWVTELRGGLVVLYQAKEATSGNVLDSDTLRDSYWREHEFGAPGTAYVQSLMLNAVARQLVGRFLPAFRSVNVPLPKGELKRASELLKKRKWNSALQTLQSTVPVKAETEAYRLYALGVVFEALAYESPDWLSTKSYLEQAATDYANAEQQNPNDKHFREAALRLSANLQSYKKFEDLIQVYEAERRQKAFENIIAAQSKNLPVGSALMTNASVVEMAKGGKSEKEILEIIKKAKVKVFDLSNVAIADLTTAGVSAETLDDMREAMREMPDIGKLRRKWWAFGMAYLAMFYPYLILL